MATGAIQSIKVAKKRRVEVDVCAYLSGPLLVTDPVEMFEQPRPATNAKGTLSNERLRAIAKKHQPPQEWYEGEEEQLF